jgi:predicted transcriptional regulator
MATSKVTFTLDSATIQRLRDAAERLAKPQSAVVCEAIQEFYERIEKLSDQERAWLLRAFDQLVPRIPRRPAKQVDQELVAIRRARRGAAGKLTRKNADDWVVLETSVLIDG